MGGSRDIFSFQSFLYLAPLYIPFPIFISPTPFHASLPSPPPFLTVLPQRLVLEAVSNRKLDLSQSASTGEGGKGWVGRWGQEERRKAFYYLGPLPLLYPLPTFALWQPYISNSSCFSPRLLAMLVICKQGM